MNPRLSEPDALYAAGVAQWRARKRDAAIKLIDEALRLRPDFAAALCMGGYMLGECGKHEPAPRFYRRALELDASLTVAHVNAGKLYFGAGRFAEALRSFEATTALAPDDPDAWSSRAGALRELGRLEESVDAARRALSLRADFPQAAVSESTAIKWLERYRRDGLRGPVGHGGHRPSALMPHREFLEAARAEKSDLTLQKLRPAGTVRNLVCGAIVTPMEGAYGNQERHPGRFAGGA